MMTGPGNKAVDEPFLANFEVVNGMFVETRPQEAVNDGPGAESMDAIRRMVSPGDFHTNLVAILNWVGNLSRLQSLRVDEKDAAFIEANAIVYDELMDGPGAQFAEWMGDENLKKLVIVSGAYVPLGMSVTEELKARRAKPVNEVEDEEIVE